MAQSNRNSKNLVINGVEADHNFYNSHGFGSRDGQNRVKQIKCDRMKCDSSFNLVVLLLLFLTLSTLGVESRKHFDPTDYKSRSSSQLKVPNHANICHSVFSPSSLPKYALDIHPESLNSVDNKIILSPIVFQGMVKSDS